MERPLKYSNESTSVQTKEGSKEFFRIETSRLLVRKLEQGDLDAYYQLFLDHPDLFHLTGSEFFEKSEMNQIFSFWESEHDKFCYVLIHRDSSALIGDFNLIRYPSFEEGEMEVR